MGISRPFVVPEPVHDKKKFPNKVALIDADRYKHVVTYNMYLEMESGKEYSEDLLISIIDKYLYDDIFSKFECKAYVFCFSAPSKQVFRNHIAQEKKYKGNRDNKVDNYFYENKPSDMVNIYNYIEKRYTTLLYDDIEADDLLSMLQHPERTFIFSHDKDLKQVVGFHYNMQAGFLEYTTEKESMLRIVCQVLQGDTVDNIPGLRGFGKKAVLDFKEEFEHKADINILFAGLNKFIEKHGTFHGMDLFAEMWYLISMRTNRGDYNKEKYAKAFSLVESLIGLDGKD
jgi:5'-3' exonuclease